MSDTSTLPMPFSWMRTLASDSPRRTGRADWVDRPADVAPGAVKNRFPKLALVLDWIWLPVWTEGAKGVWVEAVVEAGVGVGVVLPSAGRLGAPRLARRAGLDWRPSTVTTGMSTSAGAPDDAGDAAAFDGCEPGGVAASDAAGVAGAAVAAGRGSVCSVGEAAGVPGAAGCAHAKPPRPIITIDVMP